MMYHRHNRRRRIERGDGALKTIYGQAPILPLSHGMRGCSSGSNIQLSSAKALTLALLLSRTASKRARDGGNQLRSLYQEISSETAKYSCLL